MIMLRSILMLAFGSVLLLGAIRSLRAHRLKERYVLLLLAMGVPFLAMAVWPGAVDLLASRLAIEKPTVLVLCLTAFLVVMLFKLLAIVSTQERQIASLTQITAILAARADLPHASLSSSAAPLEPPPANPH